MTRKASERSAADWQISIREIFHEVHIRLLARVMVNNREDSVAVDSLALQDRSEIRELKKE
jgi:hypothetical protein